MDDQNQEKPVWKPALVISGIIIVIGPLIGYTLTANNEGDWLGLGFMAGIFLSVGLAGIIILATGIGSLFRSQTPAARSRILLILAGLILAFSGLRFLEATQKKRSLQKAQQLSSRLASDRDFRQRLLKSDSLTQEEVTALLSRQVIHGLSEDEIQTLWNMRQFGTVIHAGHLIEARNTPAAVLREYYKEVLERVRLREGKPHPRELLNHERLLIHPNLPTDVIDEIKGFQISELDKLLSKNLKLKLTTRPELEE